MLLTALPPAPPTPATMMRGLSSRSSGALRLIAIALTSFLETFLQPSPDASDVTVCSRCREIRLPVRLEMLHGRELRIDRQPDGSREAGTLCRFRQALDADRPPETNLT